MPIYEYQCRHCGHREEKLQKFSDPVSTTCPQCQKNSLKKQVSSTYFQLKGTGWYVTDFRDQSKSTQKSKDENTHMNNPSSSTKEDQSKNSSESETNIPSASEKKETPINE